MTLFFTYDFLFFFIRFYCLLRWCDQELVKFASTFGGPRILGRLALTSASGAADVNTVKSGADSSQGTMQTGPTYKQLSSPSISEMKGKLREAEEAGDYALAGSLRRALAKAEELRKEERAPRESVKAKQQKPRGAENDRQVGENKYFTFLLFLIFYILYVIVELFSSIRP